MFLIDPNVEVKITYIVDSCANKLKMDNAQTIKMKTNMAEDITHNGFL